MEREFLLQPGKDLKLSVLQLSAPSHVFHVTSFADESPGKPLRFPSAVLHCARVGGKTGFNDGFAVVAAATTAEKGPRPVSLYLRRGDALRATFPGHDSTTMRVVRVCGLVIPPPAPAPPKQAPSEQAPPSAPSDEKKADEDDEEGLLQLDKEAEEAFEEARAAAAAAAAGAPIA
jgi:hypothetical protein